MVGGNRLKVAIWDGVAGVELHSATGRYRGGQQVLCVGDGGGQGQEKATVLKVSLRSAGADPGVAVISSNTAAELGLSWGKDLCLRPLQWSDMWRTRACRRQRSRAAVAVLLGVSGVLATISAWSDNLRWLTAFFVILGAALSGAETWSSLRETFSEHR